jgi:Ca2+-binding EF-hand superfamily protein
LCSDQQQPTSNNFARSPSVTTTPPRNGSFSSNSGINITERKASVTFAEKRNRSLVMAKEQENYLPSGYTKCDLKATYTPSFQISNARAWTNPTPTPWGRDRVNLEFTQSSSSLQTATMDSKSGVVGKFRSFYSTIEQVKAAFLQYDINRDGNISRQELEDGMVQSGQFSFDEARTAFDIADINGDGEIDIAEFVQLMFPNAAEIISHMKRNFQSVDDVVNTFNSWDLNKDGSISFSELQSAVTKTGQKLSEEEMNAIFVIGDVDQNGEIDLEEFKRMMIPTAYDVVSKFRSVHKTTKDVQKAFKTFDTNNDGAIDRSELTQALTSGGMNFTQQEIDAIFNAADVDKDGQVDYEEFICLMCPSAAAIVCKFRSQYKNLDDVKAAFKRFDSNGDGALDRNELGAAMKSSGQSYSDVEIDAIFSLGDTDGDGEVSLQEFVELMSPSSSEILAKLRKNFRNIGDVKVTFKKIDTDNDGLLSKQEMLSSSGCKYDSEEVNAIFTLGDVNGDGQLDMGEFIGIMFPPATEVISKLSSSFRNIEDVKAAFKLLDVDGDGSITRQEMASSAHKFSQEQIEALFALGDVNDDGAIDLEEFIGVMCPSAEVVISRITQRYNNISEVKKAFMSIDIDHDGQITRQEMANCGKFNSQEVDAIFILGDVNGDGNIDLEEFIGLMCPTAAEAIAKMTKAVRNMNEAQQLFRILDKDGDGMISMEEMRNCGQQFSAKEIDAIFALGDVNNDGEIDVSEFVAVMCPSASTVVARISKGFKTLEDVKQAFKKLDKDGDGVISKKEMASCGLNDQQVDAIFALGDSNNDGEIDLQEFISCMCPSASAVVFKVSKLFNSKEKAAEAFKKIDLNGDGQISKDEMRAASLSNGTKLNAIEVDSIFALGDANGDGEIDMDEFLTVMVPSAGFSSSFSSSSNTQFVKKTTTSSFSSSSSSSVQQSSSSSFSQSYSATTSYSTSSSSSVAVSFSSVQDVKKAFRKFDSNGDGHLDRSELKQLLISSGKNVSDQEVNALFAQGDVDGDGMIDIQEFVKMMFPAATTTLTKVQQSFNNLNDVKAAFRRFDADGDGHISRTELRQVMSSFSEAEVDSIFALGDKDQSGGIDYQEFIAMMLPNATSILQGIASQFNSIASVKEGFKRIDTNGDGAISRQELKQGMHLSDQELEVVFALGDIDGDGEISMAEFIPLMSPSAATAMNRLRNSFRDITEVIIAFKKFDSNNDGAISQNELLSGMRNTGLDFESQECNMVFSMADTDQNGEINYVEFVSALFPAASDGLAKFRGRLGAITDVKMAFKRFDADGDGEISIMELKNGAGAGFSTGEIASVFALGDSDQNGKLSFAEFAQLVLPSAREKVCMLKKSFKNTQEVQAAFQRFDVNNDGMISCEELKNGLNNCGMRFNDQEVQTIFAMADIDGDGEISLNEFSTLLGGGSAPQTQQAPAMSSATIQFRSVDELKNAFKRFDANSDGHLDRNEFKQLVSACGGGSETEADALFQKGDTDGDGKLDYQELIKLMFPQSAQALQKLTKSFSSLNDVKAAFKKFDADGDGHISKSELQQVMKGFSATEVEAIFALGDKDQSGGIDYQEFIGLMLPNAPATIARLGMSFRSIGNVKESFKKFDVNHDGQICRTELKNGMKLSDADLDVVFALGDLDGDGEISMSEFVLIMCPLAKNAVNRFRNCFKDIHDLIAAFAQFDSNNDGAISQQELCAGMRNMRMSFSNEETTAIFAAADINQDGEIAYTEFVSLMIPTAGDALLKFRKAFTNVQNAKNAFNKFDTDGDAEITLQELKNGMGANFSDNEVKAVFALGDTDQDGSISFLEFAKLMIPSATDALAKFWKCFRDIKSVRQAFKQFDTDNDGAITRQEVIQGMKVSGRNFNNDEIDTLFILADRDGDGQIDFPEFALIMIPSAPERISKLKRKYNSKAAVEAAFKSFDANNDGAIDSKELTAGLKNSGVCLTDQEIETIFAVADQDGDGQIDMGEFCQLLGVGGGSKASAPSAGGSTSAAAIVAKFRGLYKTIDQVRSAFNQYDVDKDGSISKQELEQGMVKSGQFTAQESKLAFDLADSDGDGSIDISEFVQLMFPSAGQLISNLKQNFASEADVRAAFASWDSNKDGQISFDELKSAVQRSGQKLTEEDINAIFVVGDIDQNGEIDLDEFMKMMMPSTSDVVSKFRSIRKTVQDVQNAFKQFDCNGDGAIDKAELTSALSSTGGNFTKQEIDTIFMAADIDGNGEIDYEEFIALMCPSASDIVEKFRAKYKNVNDVKSAFKRFDRNGDGALEKGELAAALKSSGESYTDVEVNAIFSLGDVDGDGEITLEEFIALMSPSASSVVQRISKSFKNLNDVKAAFKKIDTDNDGLLSKQEIMASAGNKYDTEEVDAIFALGDVNGDGQIDMGEFISIMFPSAVDVALQVSQTFKTLDDVKQAFKLLDKDGDGSITKQEMASSGQRFNQAQIEAIFALGDINDDGALDLDEFIAVMCPSALSVVSRLVGKYKNIAEVKKAFLAIDINKDGLLSKEELAGSGKFNGQEVEAIFMLGDLNGDGEIDLEEFVSLLCPMAGMAIARLTRNVNNISDAQQLFRILDKDGDGNITQEEMRACGSRFNAQEIEAIFAIGDVDNDGAISLNEFIAVMCPSASTVVGRLSKTYGNLEEIKQGFKKLDKDSDGMISQKEMASAGLSGQEVEAIFKLGDTNGDGEIDIDEFIGVMCPSASAVVFKISQVFKGKEGAAAAFSKIDINGDGLISKQEMSSAVIGGSKLSKTEVDAIFKLGDTNNDGEIDMEEFLAVMVPSSGFSQTSISVQSSSTSFSQTTVTKSSFTSVSSTSFCSVGMTFGSVSDAKAAFQRFDINGDGVMDKEEMREMMTSAAGKKVSDAEVNALFQKGDLDGDGQVDMHEFIRLMFPACSEGISKLQKSFSTLNEVKAAFRKFDADGDGHITREELKGVMSKFSDSEVDAVFALGDRDQSGGIDYTEFIAMMIPNSGSILKKISSQFGSEKKVMEGFKKLDANGDGAICKLELKNGMRLNDQEVEVVFALGDIDQDGEISLAEFVRLMCPAAESGLNKFRNSFRNIHEVISAFKRFDENCDGALSQQELVAGTKSLGLNLSSAEVKAIFTLADVNQDGEVNYTEFVSALYPIAADGIAKLRNSLKDIGCVRQAFKKFDADGDGEISIQELKAGASSVGKFSDGELSAVFAIGDIDNDGKISFPEFARIVLPSADEKISQLKKSIGSANEVAAAFKKFDVNNDGKISSQELQNGLKSTGLNFTSHEADVIFAVADLDGDGEISLAEFEHLLGTAVSFGRVEDVKAAFFRFDKDNDGSIDRNELRSMLAATGKTPTDGEVETLFKKGDLDGDGKIDLQEFIKLMFPLSTETLSKLQKSFKSLDDVKAAFRKYDTDGDGHIVRLELRQVMSKFSELEVDAVFALGDMDKSGGIDYQEFISMMVPAAPGTIKKLSAQFRSIADIKAAFKKFDVNKDGQISREELKNGMGLSGADLDVVFALGDLDGDGEISIGEFIRVMSPSTASALARFRNTFTAIEDVVSAFRVIDSNNDGALSKQELSAGMNSFGKMFTSEEIDSVFALADVNSDGEICYDEFVSMMFPAAATALSKFRRNHKSLKNAKDAFDRFDVDGDGEICYEELVTGMGGEYTANEINAVFAMGDGDQDGQISFLEFSKIMLPSCQDALNKFWKCFKTVSSVKDAFKRFDADGDGQISREEVMQGASSCGLKLSADEVDTLFILGDKDNNGQIDFSEFAEIMIPSAPERIAKLRKCFRNRSEIESAFRRFDTNKDGAISLDEMKAGLSSCGIMFTEQEVETCFAVADLNGDGEVCLNEFVSLLSSSSGSSSNAISKFFKFCVQQAFNIIDTNKDGAISYTELSISLRAAGFSDQEIQTIFALADHDRDGEVSLNELLRALSK